MHGFVQTFFQPFALAYWPNGVMLADLPEHRRSEPG